MDNLLDRLDSRWLLLERSLPWIVLGILFLFTYVWFFQVPYVGFDFNPASGQINDVFIDVTREVNLQRGDQLLRVGSVSWDDFRMDSRLTLFDEVEVGQEVVLEILRNNQGLTIPWTVPGPNLRAILDRLLNVWWLAYIFWFVGTGTLLLVRPRDKRWFLMTAFCFLTAIWLIAGNVSRWHIGESAILLRIAVWLCVPVYLHLHWVFPRELGRIPPQLLWVGYLTAIGFAVAEWFQIPPRSAYSLGFFLAVIGSLGLLVFHFIRQPEQHQVVGLLAIAVAAGSLPSVALNVIRLSGAIPWLSGGALLALPLIPGAYFYTIYRSQLGGLEVRTNRLISLYLYLILLVTFSIILIPMANFLLNFPNAPTLVGITAALLAGLLAPFVFPRFARFIERRLLGMPLPPTQLLEAYLSRITTSLNNSNLAAILKNEVLPSLLIRQATLVRLEQNKGLVPIFYDGLDDSDLPTEADIPLLLALSDKYRPPQAIDTGEHPFPWVRLVLPLTVEDRLIGFWLLGRRDPDDLYPPSVIAVLQSIAKQTAIALVNIAQAERLRALYQANIDRQENDRASLAWDLHDEVLNRLGFLSSREDDPRTSQELQASHQRIIAYIRQAINNLRPIMLTYGLRPALEGLMDDLAERAINGERILFDVSPTEGRFDPQAELHLFRIVQQASENALRHAQAKTIRIYGSLEPEQVKLTVEDDGIGFQNPENLNFDRFLMDKHFGLAGMLERAGLIGAKVYIYSKPERGTRVSVTWRPDGVNPTP